MGNRQVSMHKVNQLLKATIETNKIDAYFDKFYHSEYNNNNNNGGCIKYLSFINVIRVGYNIIPP